MYRHSARPSQSKLNLHKAAAGRSSNWAAAVALACGLTLVPSARADIAGFTQGGAGPTDFTLNANADAQLAGRPSIVGSELLLTSNAGNQAVSAFFNTAQAIGNFTASFTYTMGAASTPPADGFAFVIQSAGLTALGGAGGALGYLGIANSAAAAFDLYNGGNASITRFGTSASGYPGFLYQDTTPVSLRTAPVNVSLAFNNGVLTQTLTQGANSVTRTSNVNIADRVGSTGFVGFTAATGGATADQKVGNFVFTLGNAPAVPAPAQAIAAVPQGDFGVFGIREVLGAPACCGNLAEAEAAILGAHPSRIDYTAPVFNLHDSGGRGRFAGDTLYKLDPDQANPDNDTVNNIAVIATGTIRVPTAGVYTFGTNSDDGFRLTIAGHRFEAAFGQGGTVINANGALEFPNGRGSGESSLGTIFLPAGDHKIQMLNWEGGGGATVELYSAPGMKTSFDRFTFSLVGGADIPDTVGRNRVMTVAPWTLKEYTGVANVTEVLNHGRNGTGTQRGTTSTVPMIRFTDPQGANNGSHGADAIPFPNDTGADDDAYGAFATTTLTIAPADAGLYSFVMYTDDDSRFRIMDNSGTPMPLSGVVGDQFDSDGINGNDQFGTNGCCFDQVGRYNLAAGTYTIEAAFHEGGGGSGFFLYGTQGDRDTFDPNVFQLLGANEDRGAWTVTGAPALDLVPEPAVTGMLALAALGLSSRRSRRQS
jgi:hypothetical protein